MTVFAGENVSTLNMNKHIMMKQLGNGLPCSSFKYLDAVITKTKLRSGIHKLASLLSGKECN